MTKDKAIEILKHYQLWRKGKPPFDVICEMDYTSKELGEAIDTAINLMRGLK